MIDLGFLVDTRSLAEKWVTEILDVIGQFSTGPIQPDVPYHPMFGGVGPGRKGRMPDDRFIIGVAVVGVTVNGSGIQQIAEPPLAEAIIVAR